MSTPSTNNLIERLFSAGAHFGFKKSRRHPTVTPYLFTSKDGNDIFDLEQSAALIESAAAVLNEAGKNGKTVYFIYRKLYYIIVKNKLNLFLLQWCIIYFLIQKIHYYKKHILVGEYAAFHFECLYRIY